MPIPERSHDQTPFSPLTKESAGRIADAASRSVAIMISLYQNRAAAIYTIV